MPDDSVTRTAIAHPLPFVREAFDTQSLHFSDSAIQSRMQLAQPDALALDYTRTMMGFVMFDAAPARIAMIGLGGGSMARFCRRHLSAAHMTVVEINPHVIALRERFQVPPDGAQFEVIEADGADFIAAAANAPSRFDVLLVDAFDADGMPEAFGTRRFYDDCTQALQPGGLLVVNLHALHPHFPVYLDRLRGSFGDHVLPVHDRDGTNCVVFARQGRALQTLVATAPAAVLLKDARSRIAQAMWLQRLAEAL